ncbi:MAG: hypothetical protein IJR94_08090 [Synergistaceae bacterium]|nr:hypothetical protein [Synergistaceae bacterium]
MSFRDFKRQLGLLTSRHKNLHALARKINLAVFHWEKRQQEKNFGPLNPSLRFFLIRSEGTDEGLMSLYIGRLREIYWSFQNNFVPFVDWKNYRTQYNIDSPVYGSLNAWEYYFEQPSNFSLEEIYQSRRVKLSGWKFFERPQEFFISDEILYEMTQRVPVKKYIREIADEKIKSNGINNMIGLLVRGTDYVKIKPAGHAVAPTPEQAAEKLDEFLLKYGARKIFLATEDENIYKFFLDKYGDLIYTSDKNLIKNYSGHDYVANEINSKNMYQFGLDYLVKMICLSECKFLITSKTAGSEFARILNHGRYLEKYIFDLGVY